MKSFKLLAMLFGAIVMIAGFNSCSKDDDSNECCTITYSYGTYSYTITACEDGTVTYNEGGEIDVGTWHDEHSNWAEVKAGMLVEGASCN